MITVKDIAKIIAAKYELSNVEAEIFMQMIVEVINDGLLNDRQVKIKGFGTFKLQAVKERSSVNVNTGEKVVIAEHDKVSFVPDAAVKDLINKPFAQFETVSVSDGSPLLDESVDIAEMVKSDTDADSQENSDVDSDSLVRSGVNADSRENGDGESKDKDYENNTVAPSQEKEERCAVVPSVSKQEEDTEVKHEDDVEEKHEPPTEDSVREHVSSAIEHEEEEAGHEEEAVLNASEEIKDIENTDSHGEDNCERPTARCRNIFIYYGVLINVFVAVVAFVIGYMMGTYGMLSTSTKEIDAPKTETYHKAAPKPQKKVIIRERTASPVKSVEDSIKVETTLGDTKKKEAEKKPQEKENEVPAHKYDSDVRVRTGAYYIVGTEKVVTVKEGQTLSSISRQTLGEGMECYVEAYNGGVKTVKKGDELKIPKLKLKKKVNREK